MNAVHFSSATDLWATPPEFFDALDLAHDFDLDVCALPDNAKCERYFTPEQDGLAQEWRGTCWMNPPLRAGHRPLGAQGLRVRAARRHRGLPAARAHRHRLVARLLREGLNPLRARSAQVWGCRA